LLGLLNSQIDVSIVGFLEEIGKKSEKKETS